ncbi:MAG: response regulator [Thermodesulfovibrionales bacterium]
MKANIKIMIVDDCPTTRKLLGLYLRGRGYDLIFAENGLDALEKLASERISLILSDLNMPYMDGIELLRSIRSNPTLSHIPFLMVTTEADEDERKRAIDSGANGYLVKPVTAELIVQNIKNILKDIFRGGANV